MERTIIDFTPKFRELTPEEALRKDELQARLPEIKLHAVIIRKQLAKQTRKRSNQNRAGLDIILRR